jgi:hypothetical protein
MSSAITKSVAISLMLVDLLCTSADAFPMTKEALMTPSDTGRQTNQVAKQAADRFLTYVTSLNATSDISTAGVQEAMRVSLTKAGEGKACASQDMGFGWTYVVKHLNATDHLKA